MSFSLASPPPWLLPVNARLDSLSLRPRSQAVRPGRSALLVSLGYRRLEASWIPAEGESSVDGCGGWEFRLVEVENRKGVPKLVFAGIGALVAILMAAVAHCSLSRRGFKFRLDAPFHGLHEVLVCSSQLAKSLLKKIEPTSLDVTHDAEEKLDDASNVRTGTLNTDQASVSVQGSKCKIVPVPVDATQQEALCVLKKLKIIEPDVGANELCTRREYARWLVKANSMLERDPRHKVVTANSSSIVAAFDDVSFNDQDFWCIQALGEAGIVHSKLSTVGSSNLSDVEGSTYQGVLNFFPESFLSRFDLVSWKALLEYPSKIEVKEKSRCGG